MKLVVSFSLFSLLKQLQDEVAKHANTEESHRCDDLGEYTHPGSIRGKGKYEAHRLPEPVVGEGCLLVVGKETPIEGIDLGLPDGVAASPEGGEGVNYWQSFCSGGPGEHCCQTSYIDERSKEKDRQTTSSLGDKAGGDGGECIGGSVGDQNFTQSGQTKGTGYKSLSQKELNMMVRLSTYSSEFSIKESLLNSGPEGDGYDEQLLLADHLFEGGHQQLHPR